jgi:hypothetical protein
VEMLGNYPFLTPRAEIKKPSLYGLARKQNWTEFSNAPAVEVLFVRRRATRNSRKLR